jgi:hypothetical protein
MRGLRACLVATALVTLLWVPAQASARSNDLVATHAYIQASYRLARAGVALIGPVQRKVQQLKEKLAQECPLVGAGSPEDEASQPMAHEVADALWSIEYGAAAGPIASFVKAVGHLRWSSGATTRIAATYARNLHELATLPLPPLCEDVRAWKATGFQTMPPRTASLAARVDAIEPRPIPPRLLAPFERGADARVLARARALETTIAENEFILGQADWIHVLETLGLQE